ncbi:hypothetical protein FRC10_000753 [Ceratobasidium sp. 414]|nr:hypothetical protein FRC10_000753 [Ceratobasidium sp. 414]
MGSQFTLIDDLRAGAQLPYLVSQAFRIGLGTIGLMGVCESCDGFLRREIRMEIRTFEGQKSEREKGSHGSPQCMRHPAHLSALYSCFVPHNDMESPQDADESIYEASDDDLDGLYDPELQEREVHSTFHDLLNDVLGSDDPFFDEDEEENVDISDLSSQTSSSQPGGNIHPTLNALSHLASTGVTLSQLISDVIFGDTSIISHDLVKAACTELFRSSIIPGMLDRIREPPQMRVRGQAHRTTKDEIEGWALRTSTSILRKELVTYAVTTKAPETEAEVVSEESLQEMTFDALAGQIMQHAPCLHALLTDICLATSRNRMHKRDSNFAVTIFINSLANQISRLNNQMQKLICIYFKAKGVPKSVYYLFYRCGITESYQWSVNALTNISNAAMAKAITVFEQQPSLVIHDNIRLPFPVKHQRCDHLTVTDNGTAMTMMPLRDPIRAASLLCNPTLWSEKKAQISSLYCTGKMPYLKASDIYTMPGFTSQHERTISNLIWFLFQIPAVKNSNKFLESGKPFHHLLAAMPPVCQLPYGPQHCNQQYMLKSVPQERPHMVETMHSQRKSHNSWESTQMRHLRLGLETLIFPGLVTH